MVLRHRLLLPTGTNGCPCFSSALSQHGRWSFCPPNAIATTSCGMSSFSSSQCLSSTLAFAGWRNYLLWRSAPMLLCANFSSRSRRDRATSTQMRLSELPLGVGEVAVIGEVGENLGPKEKAELVTPQLGDSVKGEAKRDEAEGAVSGGSDRDIKPGLRRLAGSNIVVGASLGSIRVKNAEFIKSSPGVADCPRDGLPEFAVVGRSNVGKSSLVNTLVKRKDLAQISKKPGKTQLINHFRIDNSWYLVDLPGYGFAKAPKVLRSDWNAFTKDYFLKRETLLCVLLLVDASIPPQQIDLDCADWLGRNNIPLTVVFTKCDRKKKNKNGGRKAEVNIQEFEAKLKDYFDEVPPLGDDKFCYWARQRGALDSPSKLEKILEELTPCRKVRRLEAHSRQGRICLRMQGACPANRFLTNGSIQPTILETASNLNTLLIVGMTMIQIRNEETYVD